MMKKLRDLKKGDSIFIVDETEVPSELYNGVVTKDAVPHYLMPDVQLNACPDTDTSFVVFYKIDGRPLELSSRIYGEFTFCKSFEGHIVRLFTDLEQAVSFQIYNIKNKYDALYKEIDYKWKKMDKCVEKLKKYGYDVK